jgi:alpha-beta hydrolase superfamily lysophospholipase
MASSTRAQRRPSLTARLLRWMINLVLIAAGVFLAGYVGVALDSRRKPDLAPWHTVSLASEFRAQHAETETNFDAYLAREARVFEELDREVYQRVERSPEMLLSRYLVDGPTNPQRLPKNWNRSYQLAPPETPSANDRQGAWPRGAALLIHGLTDSPYSLRSVGEILQQEGYHVVGVRLPGHGTNPGSLATTTWQDWKAAVRIAARHTNRLSDGGKFVVVGYSAGGALAVENAIDSLLDDAEPTPDRLVLFSPAIGVTRFAAFASWHKAFSWMSFFEKFGWTDIAPEYDPFKYNSFPLNAGEQMHLLALAVQKHLRELDRADRMDEMPEALAFQSMFDSTVLTDAIRSDLFDDLEQPGSELILFDLNRVAPLRPFIRLRQTHMLDQIETGSNRYGITVVGNLDDSTGRVVARSYAPGTGAKTTSALGVNWPPGVHSLSHVAIPFAPDDPLYGTDPSAAPPGMLHLGTLAPRGERGVLRVSVNQIMRLRYNPFFSYVESRLRKWVD